MTTKKTEGRPSSKGQPSNRAKPQPSSKRKKKSTPAPMNRASALKAWEADLWKSNIKLAEAKKRGMKLLAPATTRSMTKTAKYAGAYVWSYLIPYFDVKGKKTKYWRIRYLEDVLGPFGARPKKPRRYTGPKGAKIRAYFDPTVDYSTVRKGK